MSRRRGAAPGGGPPTTHAALELIWPGKYDAHGERVRPSTRTLDWRARERHGPGEGEADTLVRGDNLDVLEHWRARHEGKVDLVYMDPPFSTGGAFSVTTRVGEHTVHSPAYGDSWPGGPAAFLAMLAPRLERVHALLAPHGSLYVHVDPTIGHAVKLLLDEIFGAASFQREIIWRIGWVSGFKTRANNWIRNHDTIFFYVKDPAQLRFHKVWVPHPPGYQRRAGTPARAPGIPVDDVWNAGSADLALTGNDSLDSIQIKSFSREKTGYGTQKNESLLRRILSASSMPGELVLDPFCGSGTTLAVAQAMRRRWLGCDLGRAAIQLARTRLCAGVGARAFELIEATPQRSADEHAALRCRVLARVPDARFSALPLDDAGVAGVLGEREHGVQGHVIAPSYVLALPLHEHDGSTVVGPWAITGKTRLAVLDAEAIARDEIEAVHALPELAQVTLELQRVARDRYTLRVRDYGFVDDAALAETLRAAVGGFADLIAELAVEQDGDDDVLRPQRVRTRGEPLELELELDRGHSNVRVVVQLLDVRHTCTRIELELARDRSGWRVAAARQHG